MHDATKVLLGVPKTNDSAVDNLKGTIAAGLVVRHKSDGTISVAAADGPPRGVSLGTSLSGLDRTSMARRGLKIPLILTAAFTPTLGAQVHISDTTGKGIASGAGATGMNATYASGLLTGIQEDGTEIPAALIDMPGGL